MCPDDDDDGGGGDARHSTFTLRRVNPSSSPSSASSTDPGTEPPGSATPSGRGPGRRRYDPDRLAHLEEERDFLLASLDDLDAEHAAGDVSQADFEELRDGYTVRAAEAIREISAIEEGRERGTTGAATRSTRGWVWILGTVLFALAAGVVLARNAGLRSGDETLTGTIADGAGDTANCIDESFGDTDAGIACFDEVLAETPGDLEAQTYRAWARVRGGDIDTGRAELDEVIAADPTYPDAYVFRAVVARDDGDAVAARTYLDTLYGLDPAPSLLNTLAQMGLERQVAVALLSEDAAACWEREDEALVSLNSALTTPGASQDDLGAATEGVVESDRCWKSLLDATPDDVDALTLRAYGLLTLDLTLRNGARGVSEIEEISVLDDTVIGLVDRALVLEAGDPDALVLRAAMRFVTGDVEGASDDLVSLGDQRISPLLSGVDAGTLEELIATESDGG